MNAIIGAAAWVAVLTVTALAVCPSDHGRLDARSAPAASKLYGLGSPDAPPRTLIALGWNR